MDRNNKTWRKLFVILIFLNLAVFLTAQTAGPSKGEKLFKENKPEDAVQVLENEILNGQISANTYNFLGLGYYQLGAYEKSVNAFQRGIEVQPSNIRILSYNQGNAFYAQKKYRDAVASYTKSFNDDSTFFDALLNRANALLMDNQYRNARNDYILFLEKCPNDPQHEAIEEIIRLLEEEMERLEEEARLAAEANKAIWEAVETGLPENKSVVEKGPDWEPVDELVESSKQQDNKPDWEKIEEEKLKKPVVYKEPDEKVEIELEEVKDDVPEMPAFEEKNEIVKEDNSNKIPEPEPWEQVDAIVEKPTPVKEQKQAWEQVDNLNNDSMENLDYNKTQQAVENDDLTPSWENLDSSEIEEMNRLEEESLKEREKYLAEQEKKKEQEKLDRKLKEQMSAMESENYREQIRQEMMAAEEARRQQLLDDVANSLRKTDSENMTSGAEDIIDYEFEGELD